MQFNKAKVFGAGSVAAQIPSHNIWGYRQLNLAGRVRMAVQSDGNVWIPTKRPMDRFGCADGLLDACEHDME
jgi:hypothetical protein